MGRAGGTFGPLACLGAGDYDFFNDKSPWGRSAVKAEWSLVGVWQEKRERGSPVAKLIQQLWNDEQGQDIAEYAVMLAVILVIVVGTIRLIGSNANTVFSEVGSSIQ